MARIAFLLLLAPMLALANGGPSDGSRVLGAGSVEFDRIEDVRLVSEDLRFEVVGDTVEVEAVYVLQCDGPSRNVGFAFPVDFLADHPELFWLEDVPLTGTEVSGFTIRLDGRVLPLESFITDDTGRIEVEGFESDISSLWFGTDLELHTGSTHTLVVEYSFIAQHLDWETNKSWFPSCSERLFTYRIDPAGNWGDGTAGEFSCTIDLSSVLSDYGSVIEIPESFEMGGEGLYVWSESGMDIRSLPAISVSWDNSTWRRSQAILARRLGAGTVTSIRTSSELQSQGSADYCPGNLLDLDFDTAWSEGESGDGSGSWIEMDFDTCLLGGVYLINGYVKNEASYEGNARIRTVRITLEPDEGNPHSNGCYPDRVVETVTLDDMQWSAIDIGDFSSRMQEIFLNADPGYPASSLRIEVVEVYPGTTWDDLCATEILLVGYTREHLESRSFY